MRFRAKDNPHAARRYAHVPRAARFGPGACGARDADFARSCTREQGHRPPHVAHDLFGRVGAVWDEGPAGAALRFGRGHEVSASGGAVPAPRRRGAGSKEPVGLPVGRPADLLTVARGVVRRIRSSWPEIAFVVLFLVFVKLAIDVLLTLR